MRVFPSPSPSALASLLSRPRRHRIPHRAAQGGAAPPRGGPRGGLRLLAGPRLRRRGRPRPLARSGRQEKHGAAARGRQEAGGRCVCAGECEPRERKGSRFFSFQLPWHLLLLCAPARPYLPCAICYYNNYSCQVGKGYVLLNCDDHKNFLRRNGRDPADYRPDICHQARKKGIVPLLHVGTAMEPPCANNVKFPCSRWPGSARHPGQPAQQGGPAPRPVRSDRQGRSHSGGPCASLVNTDGPALGPHPQIAFAADVSPRPCPRLPPPAPTCACCR